jgi:large subunit ribosomal protein L17
LLCQLTGDLLKHGAITTTTKRAQALRDFLNPLFRRARENQLAERRMVISTLRGNRDVYRMVRRYIDELAPKKFSNYLRLIPLPPRSGDAAPLVRIELLRHNQLSPRREGKKK